MGGVKTILRQHKTDRKEHSTVQVEASRFAYQSILMKDIEGRLKQAVEGQRLQRVRLLRDDDPMSLFAQAPLGTRSSISGLLDARVHSFRGSLVSTKVVVRVSDLGLRDLASGAA